MFERQLLNMADREIATDKAPNEANAAEDLLPGRIRTLIKDNLLDEANQIVTRLLRTRMNSGDTELAAVNLLLQHYRMLIARQPPLSHVDTVPLHPNGHLYECFDRFIDLMAQQNKQISEMSVIISELI